MDNLDFFLVNMRLLLLRVLQSCVRSSRDELFGKTTYRIMFWGKETMMICLLLVQLCLPFHHTNSPLQQLHWEGNDFFQLVMMCENWKGANTFALLTAGMGYATFGGTQPGWVLASGYRVLLLWGGVAAMNCYPPWGVQVWNLKCRGLEQVGTWNLSQTFMRKKEIFKSKRSLSRADLQVHLLSMTL